MEDDDGKTGLVDNPAPYLIHCPPYVQEATAHLEVPFTRYQASCPQCYITSPIPEYPCTSPLPFWCVDGRRGFSDSDLHAMLE